MSINLTPPKNANYAVTVVEVKHLNPLEGCDNVVGLGVFGMQAVVGKDTQIGDLGLIFPVESQIADEFAHHNNLYRHADKNADPGKAGYIEDNRRVRAQKFRGHTSNALFMPLESLAYLGCIRPRNRDRYRPPPTSGKMPIVVSGMARTVRSVATR